MKAIDLRVVFDTNPIYSDSATDVVRRSTATFLREYRKKERLQLRCFMPEVVREERRFQMFTKARATLRAMQKLECVLPGGLRISEEMLSEGIAAHIAKTLDDLGITTLALDTAKVDWNRVCLDVVRRDPPFSTGESEKGFRDLLIGETFIQFVEASADANSDVKFVLLSADERLATMVRQRLSGRADVTTFNGVQTLGGFINSALADVSDAFIKAHQLAATRAFFVRGDKATLFYSQNLGAY